MLSVANLLHASEYIGSYLMFRTLLMDSEIADNQKRKAHVKRFSIRNVYRLEQTKLIYSQVETHKSNEGLCALIIKKIEIGFKTCRNIRFF